MLYTQQQLNFINSNNKRIVLESIAGSGKSTSIIGKINKNTNSKNLVLTFSKNLEIDLNQKLQNKSTKICTIHSLAYNILNVRQYGNVSSGSTYDIKKCLNTDNIDTYIIHTLLGMFCSSDKTINNFFSYILNNISTLSAFIGYSNTPSKSQIDKHLEYVYSIFHDTRFMSHSKYLKMFQLSDINLFDYTDIYIDEYQDLDDCMMSIVLDKTNTDQSIYLVGDKNQKIFDWKGTTSLMPNDFIEMRLTKSMRCPQEILNTANSILLRKNENIALNSDILENTIIEYETYEQLCDILNENVKNITLIGSTNTHSIAFLIDYISNSKQTNYNINLEFNFDIDKFSKYYKYCNKQSTGTWIDTKTYQELIDYFSLIKNDNEIFLLISARTLVSSNVKLETFVNILNSNNTLKPTLTFTNVFISKGREFDNVVILNDFYTSGLPFLKNSYINYIYTAITRTKNTLIICSQYKQLPSLKVIDVEFKGLKYLDKIMEMSDLYNKEFTLIKNDIIDDNMLNNFLRGMSKKDFDKFQRINNELSNEKNMRDLGILINKYS